MQEIQNKKEFQDSDDQIDLKELFFVIIQGKKLILLFTAFLSIIGITYSLLLPNVYESKALLSPVESSSNNISGALGNFSGLAGLAGIDLFSGNEGSNSKKAIETIGSLSFFEKNIMPKIFLPDLMAIKTWKNETNSIIYDDNIFDINSDTWVRDFSFPNKLVPSAQESFEVFIDDHLNISEDVETGFITLSIKHQSPYLAKQWVDLIVKEINTFYRQKDKSDSEKAVVYLNDQMAMTRLSEMTKVIAELLQQEIQKLTLIEAKEAYVFDYIYPPSVMEKNSEPRRSLIFILSVLLGGTLSILFVLIRHYVFNKKTT